MTRTGVVITLFVLTIGFLQVVWFFTVGARGVDPLTTPDAVRYYLEATGVRAYLRLDSIFDSFYFPITEAFGSVLRIFYSLGLKEPESLVVSNYVFNVASGLIFLRIARLRKNRMYILATVWCLSSPILLDHSAQLLKESFVIFLFSAVVYAFWTQRKLLLVFVMLFGTLIRPYFLFYGVAYLLICNLPVLKYRSGFWFVVSNFAVGALLFVTKPAPYVTAVGALLLIPKFWSASNLENFLPQVIEANIATLLFLFAALRWKKYRFLAAIFLVCFANLFVFISEWRLAFGTSTWSSDAVLLDNFYRKKVPVVLLQLLFFIEAYSLHRRTRTLPSGRRVAP